VNKYALYRGIVIHRMQTKVHWTAVYLSHKSCIPTREREREREREMNVKGKAGIRYWRRCSHLWYDFV